eukprot:gene7191-6793_t
MEDGGFAGNMKKGGGGWRQAEEEENVSRILLNESIWDVAAITGRQASYQTRTGLHPGEAIEDSDTLRFPPIEGGQHLSPEAFKNPDFVPVGYMPASDAADSGKADDVRPKPLGRVASVFKQAEHHGIEDASGDMEEYPRAATAEQPAAASSSAAAAPVEEKNSSGVANKPSTPPPPAPP